MMAMQRVKHVCRYPYVFICNVSPRIGRTEVGDLRGHRSFAVPFGKESTVAEALADRISLVVYRPNIMGLTIRE